MFKIVLNCLVMTICVTLICVKSKEEKRSCFKCKFIDKNDYYYEIDYKIEFNVTSGFTKWMNCLRVQCSFYYFSHMATVK